MLEYILVFINGDYMKKLFYDSKLDDNIDRINEIRSTYYDEILFYLKCFIISYSKAVRSFGFNDKVTKESFSALKECLSINKKEREIFYFILNNIKDMDSDAVEKYLNMLEDLSTDTILYYTELFENIEYISEIEDSNRFYRFKKKFNTLIEDDIYEFKALSMMLNNNTIKELLNYPQEFWDFIKPKVKVLNSSIEVVEHMTFVCPIYNDKKEIVDFIIAVPQVVDYDSALIAIRRYKDAFLYWSNFGKSIDEISNNHDYSNENNSLRLYLKNKINNK